MGLRVALVGRDPAKLERTRDQLTQKAGPALVAARDVADRASVNAAVEGVLKDFGGIDVPVCNAGRTVRNRSLEVLDPADWDLMIATNLTGAFNLVHAVLPRCANAAQRRPGHPDRLDLAKVLEASWEAEGYSASIWREQPASILFAGGRKHSFVPGQTDPAEPSTTHTPDSSIPNSQLRPASIIAARGAPALSRKRGAAAKAHPPSPKAEARRVECGEATGGRASMSLSPAMASANMKFGTAGAIRLFKPRCSSAATKPCGSPPGRQPARWRIPR